MTAEQKAKQLFDCMISVCKSKSDAKIAAIQVCDEVLHTKNFPNTLHPEFVAFENAYWDNVIGYIHQL